MLKKILSYVWPITTRITTRQNGVMKVIWIDGKKYLDSKHANYSYGSLQKILEKGLAKVDLKGVRNVLLLGLGGGCVVQSLRGKFGFTGPITAVELDPDMIRLAAEEFGVASGGQLQIECADALVYAQKRQASADLVIVDLFIDDTVPEAFYGSEFGADLGRLVPAGGTLLFNAGIDLEEKDARFTGLLAHLEKDFRLEVMRKVEDTNVLILGTRLP